MRQTSNNHGILCGYLFYILAAALLSILLPKAAAYDPLDPTGNVTIKWDVMSWTPDGYVAVVTMNNFQMFRHIRSPGWTLGWSWAKKEVIWSIVGAQTTEQGDCSKFKGNIPHCCQKTPSVVDLLPGVPYNQQIANCCKGGVVASWGQDPAACSVLALATLAALPRLCLPLSSSPPNYHLAVTWNVTCTYSQFLASKNPTCCVSFSSFYNDTITPCPTCACGCHNKNNCIQANSKTLSLAGINTPRKDNKPLLQCTRHMCPIRIHWHLKLNYEKYWRAKIAITNFNYRLNYTQWTLVVQHPNLSNLTQVFSFDYKPIVPYQSINDTGMFYGMKFYNDLLMEAGALGNVQSEILLQKDKDTFSLRQGWAFPRKVYFNGDECMLPPPDAYPSLPNTAPLSLFVRPVIAVLLLLMAINL